MKYIKIDEKKIPKHSLNTHFTYDDVKDEENLAVLVEEPYIVIDVDNEDDFNIMVKATDSISCKVMRSSRGGHFWFMNAEPMKNLINVPTCITIPVDIKSHGKKSLVTVKHKGVWREWLRNPDSVSKLPKWLKPLQTKQRLAGMGEGDGRNAGLFSLIIPLIKAGYNKDEVKSVFKIINKHVFRQPLESYEIDAMIDDNEKFDNSSQLFMVDGKFKHNLFADWISKTYHTVFREGRTFIYDNGVYISDSRKLEQVMIDQIPELRDGQRTETLKYLRLLDSTVKNPADVMVSVENGILNASDGTLINHSPDYFFTSKINAKYQPGVRCHDLEVFFSNLFGGSVEMVQLVEEMLGYILMNSVKFQKVFILVGAGGNGKSTFVNMLREWVGVENTSSLSIEDTSHRFRASAIVDKKLNIGDDISENMLENSSTFKSLVTGDSITLEKKGVDSFDYVYKGKMIFTSNTMPKFKDKSDGMSRRLILIPFNTPFRPDTPGYDADIESKITTDEAKAALLNMAVRGLKRLLDNNRFTDPDAVKDMFNEFKKDNNNILMFLDDYTSEMVGIESKKTYADYQIYCVENNYKAQSSKKFYAAVRDKIGLEVKPVKQNGKVVRIWT